MKLGKLVFLFAFHCSNIFAADGPYIITAYEVQAKPNFTAHSISGVTTLTVHPISKFALFSIQLNGLQVENVKLDQGQIPFQVKDGLLKASIPSSVADQDFKISISYYGEPSKGLIFGKDFVYTAFSTCYWMICDEDPGIKSKFTLDLTLPKAFKIVASGEKIASHDLGNDLVQYTWRQERPYSSYLFGFAAGRFNEATLMAGKTSLRLLGAEDTAESLRTKFNDTEKMINFFVEKSGVEFPHKNYTQILVPGDEAQELSSFSVLGKDVVDNILKNSKDDWGIAHELAHQWWGNLLTCESWKHFWLNEGITVFMVAAYKEKRWGKAAYDAELDLARKRHQKAIDVHFDKPLTFDGTYPSLQIRRAIVYSKGALFMDALRNTLGEEKFWAGFRDYTQQYVGKSVDSKKFQVIMENVSGRNLTEIFKKWVN